MELNKADWLVHFARQLILGIIWLENQPLCLSEIKDKISSMNINLQENILERAKQSLRDADLIFELPDGKWKLTEKKSREIEEKVKNAENIEKAVFEKFQQAIKNCGIHQDAKPLWDDFNSRILIPLVKDLGAKFFAMFFSGFDISSVSVESLLSCYPKNEQAALRDCIEIFLDPNDKNIRSYMLNLLDAYLVVEASGISKDHLESLRVIFNKLPQFKILVDTNFIFSALGLHNNPSNEAVNGFMYLINSIKNSVSVKLYLSPLTRDEAIRVFSSLREIKLSPNITQAVLDADLTSAIRRNLLTKLNSLEREGISYYEKNIISILRDIGIELFNDRDFDKYKTRKEIIDDIKWLQGASKIDKPYRSWEHDVVLWHFCKNKRPVRVESPLDAEYWFLTIDYNFIKLFDKNKTKKEEVPICLHPSQLIQILRFWVPRDEKMEKAVFDSLRLPILFGEFDPKIEEAIIRILEIISRFENQANLPPETVKKILVSESLRQKIIKESNEEKRFELVKESIIDDLKDKDLELKTAEGKLAITQQSLMARESETKQKDEDIKSRDDTIKALEQKMKQGKEQERKWQELWDGQQKKEKELLEERRERQLKRNCVRKRGLFCTSLILLFALLNVATYRLLFPLFQEIFKWSSIRIGVTVEVILLAGWFLLALVIGRKISVINSWVFFKKFQRLAKAFFIIFLLGILIHLVSAIIGGDIKI